MSGIDELKQNATEPVRINIGAESGKRKPIVLKNVDEPTPSSERIEVDLTAEFPKEQPEEIHESYVKDILDGEDSPFGKYLKEKKDEYEERMATYEQEKELLEEAEEESELDSDEEVDFGTDSLANNLNNDYDESLDEEEDEIAQINVQKEDLGDLVESSDEEESYDEEKEVEEKTEEAEEEIENPDIDLNVTNIESKKEDIEIEEEDDSVNDVDQDEMLKHLQKLATERLKPVSQSLNISSFTVLKKPTAKINIATEQVKAAKWVIPTQDSVVLMKEFLGSELETLREFSEDTTSVSQLYRKYRTIYDHIASPKPATYEAWLKTTPYSDIDHYFFAVYIASFKGANYIPLDCQEKGCNKTFLTEDVPIMNMVKFATNEAKEKFVKLYESEATPAGKGIYCSEIVPLSNKIAIGFKDASIYSLFEIASLTQKDRDKYSSIVEFIPYIDALYIINEENKTLEPVGYKIFPDNATKTVKSKISTFFKVLKNLSVDEFTPIKSFIRSITSRSEGIGYIYPSVDCPYCGKPTKEIPTSAEELVFTRYQLSALVNTSLK